jgi:hypothetical protein
MMTPLSKERVRQYEDNGCLFPIDALSPEEAATFLAEIDALQAREGKQLWAKTKMKPYLQIHALNRLMPHRDTFAAGNLLSRGQDLDMDVKEDQAVFMELAAGNISLHHSKIVHGSATNRPAWLLSHGAAAGA